MTETNEDAAAWGLDRRGPYRDGQVHVLDAKCATCIFRPGNLMRLAPGRVESMVEGTVAAESAITCHSTLGTDDPAVCRGFYDVHRERVFTLRLALAMGIVVFDPVPPKRELP